MPSLPNAGARPAPPAAGFALEALTLAALVIAVFGGALGYFFAQDDFAGLARVRGLIPPLDGPWRYVPGQVYYELMEHLAGTNPVPYRIASLGLHVVNALLARALVGRYLAAPAAWLVAACFAVHPAPFTALYWVSGVGDLIALSLALATALIATRPGPSRWLALPLFALALASKEAVVLLPLWIALARRWPLAGAAEPDPVARRGFDPLDAALAILSASFVIWFLNADAIGIRSAIPGPSAYELRFDRTLIENLLTYAGWTANHFIFSVRGFADAVDPGVFPWGIAALIAGVAGAFVSGLRARGWVLGLAWYLAFMLPALPLPHHTYHYYLYVALPGATWCLGAVIEFAVLARLDPARRGSARGGPGERRGKRAADGAGATARAPARTASRVRAGAASMPAGRRAAAWTLAGGLGFAFALNGALLVRKIESYPFVMPELRADPTVDRALIARRAHDDLAAARLPNETRLVFWSPDSLERAAAGTSSAAETYADRNVRGALYDGLAARVLFPEVREAYFSRSLGSRDSATLYAIYRRDGHLEVVSGSTLDSLIQASRTP